MNTPTAIRMTLGIDAKTRQSGQVVKFRLFNDFRKIDREVMIPRPEWLAMGQPQSVTVTIEPGCS